MKNEFETLYLGFYTNKLQALLYNAIFCIRRLDIVFINIVLSPGFPLIEKFEHNPYLIKILCFLLIQTIYVMYVWETKPHTRDIFNKLEFFNEGMIVLMCYIMIGYSGIGSIEYILSSNIQLYISLAMTFFVVIANFCVMFQLTY